MSSSEDEAELKQAIRDFHDIWYQDWLNNPTLILKLHRKLELLFNYAGIESTLVERNPGECSPSEYKRRTGARE